MKRSKEWLGILSNHGISSLGERQHTKINLGMFLGSIRGKFASFLWAKTGQDCIIPYESGIA